MAVETKKKTDEKARKKEVAKESKASKLAKFGDTEAKDKFNASAKEKFTPPKKNATDKE